MTKESRETADKMNALERKLRCTVPAEPHELENRS